jgi:hypothetical protein
LMKETEFLAKNISEELGKFYSNSWWAKSHILCPLHLGTAPYCLLMFFSSSSYSFFHSLSIYCARRCSSNGNPEIEDIVSTWGNSHSNNGNLMQAVSL